MKLSIVIPAYNEEGYIGKCLESVVAAKIASAYQVEIIAVNNASVDRTRDIILSFPDVKLVDEPRKGLPQARQSGFEATTGELIANIDADTLVPAQWIDYIMVEFTKNDDLVALSGPYIYYDRSKFNNFLVRLYYYLGYFMHVMNHHVFHVGAMIQGGNFVLRRTALEQIGGYDTSIKFYGEDADVANRISKVGRVKFTFSMPMYTSARRFDKEGLWKTGWKYFMSFLSILFRHKPADDEYTYVGSTDKPGISKGK